MGDDTCRPGALTALVQRNLTLFSMLSHGTIRHELNEVQAITTPTPVRLRELIGAFGKRDAECAAAVQKHLLVILSICDRFSDATDEPAE